ncbi:hypothetical protein M440DRAFT_1008394 [Trichoderma longibrachiatum ATCC 18648]|uniref:Uncharacterized protein n=1 Tax=Trichoderma longibrachiatum ATCC 18648 TaxID=983965 RepID=A0A2T4CHW3_TRILO|nr:hypothetical protein M440DRAFT_1008394 [Trichoderma longibrachiatum ATCC 18648]
MDHLPPLHQHPSLAHGAKFSDSKAKAGSQFLRPATLHLKEARRAWPHASLQPLPGQMAAMGRKKGPPAIGLVASLPHMLCFAVLSDGVHVHSLPSDRSASPRLQVCDTYRFFSFALFSMGIWTREQNRLDILLLLAGQLEKVRGRNTAGPARSFLTVGCFEGHLSERLYKATLRHQPRSSRRYAPSTEYKSRCRCHAIWRKPHCCTPSLIAVR